MPAVTLPKPGEIIVTNRTRAELEASSLTGLEFRPVRKVHIARVDWEGWDQALERPPQLPRSGEPENIILSQRHDESASEQVGELWEILVPRFGAASSSIVARRPLKYLFEVELDPTALPDMFRPSGVRHIMVTAAARTWFESHAAGCVAFERARILLPPS